MNALILSALCLLCPAGLQQALGHPDRALRHSQSQLDQVNGSVWMESSAYIKLGCRVNLCVLGTEYSMHLRNIYHLVLLYFSFRILNKVSSWLLTYRGAEGCFSVLKATLRPNPTAVRQQAMFLYLSYASRSR